jgi:hypothetical protein
MITEMLETLLRREYETYSPQEAADNLSQALSLDQLFSEVIAPPQEKPHKENEEWPTPKEVRMWVEDFLMSRAGQMLLNQVGAPLSKQENSEMNLEEMTLSDLLPQLTIASEWDSEGPNLHSNMSNPQSSEA